MPRRRVPEKRTILPDPKFHNKTLAKFMNHVMFSGKKAVAEKIVYGALDRIQERTSSDPLEVPGLAHFQEHMLFLTECHGFWIFRRTDDGRPYGRPTRF